MNIFSNSTLHQQQAYPKINYWLFGLLLSILYFALAKFGLVFTTVANNITLIWPPSGLALFVLLVFGRRFWPWIAIGAFVTNTTTGVPYSVCLSIAIGNTLEAVIAVYLLSWAKFDTRLERVRDVFLFILFAVIISTMVSATMGTFSLGISNIIPWQKYTNAWLTWWMGDAMGDLVFATLLLSWWHKDRMHLFRGRTIEALILVVSVSAITQFIFSDQIMLWGRQLPISFMTFPFLLWSALRFGLRGATTVVFIIGSVILFNIIFHRGVFSQGTTFESLTLLWLYTNFLAITSLVLAAAINERYIAEKGMQHLAQHDYLTGLPNRIFLLDRIHQSINQAERHHNNFALLFIDIDRFKVINDSLGHSVGDDMLKLVSDRLINCIRNQDTISRLGGDEFVILVEEVSQPGDIYIVANKIMNALRLPIIISKHELHSSASIGICLYPNDGHNAETLLKHADIAMYRAKEIGRDTYMFYSSDMNEHAEKRLNMENDLHKAFENNEFSLHYQPQYSVKDNKIKSAEALLRWKRSDGKQVSPDEFIPVLEETGQIDAVGTWVINQACKQLSLWQLAGMDTFKIAINLSSYQLNNPSLVHVIKNAIDQYNLNPECIELEITESMLVRQDKKIEETLEQIVQLGVRMAVDDFGTGYSSLSYLHRLSIDTLKIDRSFIENVPGNQNSEAIAKAIAGLGKSLHLTLIAEGVENKSQLNFISELDCDYVQGFLLSRPLTVEDFNELLRNSK